MKKTELKVNINCEKCKTQVLKAVAKLEGVDQVAVDAEKGILTVVGEVDPVCVTTRVRKTGKYVEVISVGPPKKPAPPPKDPAVPAHSPLPPCCPQCPVVLIDFESREFDRGMCTIL